MVDEGINMKKGDPNYAIKQLAVSCAARRNYPDLLSMPRIRAVGGGCTPMGCRSFLHRWHDAMGNEVWDGRNNLGVVSINLPRIALESSSQEEFWSLLDSKLDVCKEALLARIDRLKDVKAKVAPILYMEGALGYRLNAEDSIMEVFKDGRSSISLGYIGVHEMCNAIFGTDRHIYESKEKQEFGLEVVKYLREKTNEWKSETGWAFGLYSTPSESLCDRFCRIDVSKFGSIAGVTNRGYYTNSFHLDVEKKVSPMDKIDFEAPYHIHASSGHISYIEVPNIEMKFREIFIETCWDYAMERLPYFGTNCVIDSCHECMQNIDAVATDEGFACPNCGNTDPTTLEVTKRVCGYLGQPNSRAFIDGKQKEVQTRVKHK